MFPRPKPSLAVNTLAYESEPMVKPTGFREYDARWLFEAEINLMVGNPSIADITVLKNNGMMVITGKSYGETNLIAVDLDGNPVAESIIRVTSGADAMLVVQRGAERETYNCAPRCLPVVQLGDGKVFADAVGQIQSRNSIAIPPKP